MADRRLRELKQYFNAERNINFIINETFKNILTFKKVEIIEDEYFNDIFNKVSTEVFRYHSRTPGVDILELNNAVINELTDYIIANIDNFDTKKIVYKKQSKAQYDRMLREERKNRGMPVSDSDSNSDSNSEDSYDTLEYTDEDNVNVNTRKKGERRPLPSKKGRKPVHAESLKEPDSESEIDIPRKKTKSKEKSFKKGTVVMDVTEKPKKKKIIKRSATTSTKTPLTKPEKASKASKKFETSYIAPEMGCIINSGDSHFLSLDLNETSTSIHLDNVKSIRLKLVDVVNSDYMITKENCTLKYKMVIKGCETGDDKLIYSEDYTVSLQEGNYTKQSLMSVLKEATSLNGTNLDFLLCDTTNKLAIKSDKKFIFDWESSSSLLGFLGFTRTDTSASPTDIIVATNVFFLSKKRRLPISIGINDTDPIIEEIIYLDENRTCMNFDNCIKIYTTPVTIDSIYIDFDTYNFRGVPFFVKLEFFYG